MISREVRYGRFVDERRTGKIVFISSIGGLISQAAEDMVKNLQRVTWENKIDLPSIETVETTK